MIVTDKLVTGSGKTKMAASKLQRRISQHVHKIATKFQRPPMFLESSYSINIVTLLYDQTGGNQKWKNQDGGLETSKNIISACTQDSDEIPTALRMFLESSYPINLVAMVYEHTGGNRVGKTKMAAPKLQIRLSQLVHKVATTL